MRLVTVCCGVKPKVVGTVVTGQFYRCPHCQRGDYWSGCEVREVEKPGRSVGAQTFSTDVNTKGD